MQRWLRRVTILAVVGGLAAVADACPMCGNAIATGKSNSMQHIPTAFFCSILFMLSMPLLLLGGFSIGFYRLSKRGRPAPVSIEQSPAP